MLWSVNNLRGYQIEATDDVLGSVDDLYFEDRHSTVRYLVVDTGTWLPGRKVLIAPAVVGRPDPTQRLIPVQLTRQQVKDSPDIDTDKPVSRQHEEALYGYYGWSPYWTAAPYGAPTAGPYWGAPAYGPGAVPPRGAEAGVAAPAEREAIEAERGRGDPHLRSAREVIGYYVEATDGDIGHVEDLLVEDASWTIRYIVVDTRNWLPGKKVIISPQWLRWVDWGSQKIGVDVPRERIERSPEYDPRTTLDRSYEEALHRHYERPMY
jgi:uncharacterized protein YrrD